MFFRLFFSALICLNCFVTATSNSLTYKIDKTWDGYPVPPESVVTIHLKSNANSRDVIVEIDAPFYGDPPPEDDARAPLIGLWNYEVVELFFLNDDNQYLDVEIGPHGHYIVILLGGERDTIRHSLPLTVSAAIKGDRWTARSIIPATYLPLKVTKFNAYAVHGTGKDRTYMALYPSDGTTSEPDFHNLNFFRPIDMSRLSPLHGTRSSSSLLWQTAVQGIIPFVFDRDWKNEVSGFPPTVVTLQGFKGGVEMNYTVPRRIPKKEFQNLGIIFENDDNQAIRVSVSADGTYSVELVKDRNDVLQGRTLPLDSIFHEQETSLTGSLLIPPSYFPRRIKRLNVYSVFGTGSKEDILTLQPLDEYNSERADKPDMQNPRHFIPIDIDFLLENNIDQPELWSERLAASLFVPKVETPTTAKMKDEEMSQPETPSAQEGDHPASTPSTTEKSTSKLEAFILSHQAKIAAKRDQETTSTTTTTTPSTTTTTTKAKAKVKPKRRKRPPTYSWIHQDRRRPKPPRPLIGLPSRFGSQPFFTHGGFYRSLHTEVGDLNKLVQEKGDKGKGTDKFETESKGEEEMSIPIDDFLKNLSESGVSLSDDTLNILDDVFDDSASTPIYEDEIITTETPELLESPDKTNLSNLFSDLSGRSDIQDVPSLLTPDGLSSKPPATPSFTEKTTTRRLIVVKPTESPKLPPWGGLPNRVRDGPPPHPVCYAEGLVPNPIRCQVFHECVIEEGRWVMYNWRCIRGRRFDSEKVECVVGLC